MRKNILLKKRSILPGFGLSLGYTVFYLSIIVIIPLIYLFSKSFTMSFSEFISLATDARIVASYKITIFSALIASLFNTVFGTMLAWILVRGNFWGKGLLDAIIDLPFALPTAIAGIALATVFSTDGLIGSLFYKIGIKISYTQAGIIVALIFVGIPFVVRTIEPVLEDFDKEIEEAAKSLGASDWKIFYKIILPTIMPAVLTGFATSFARGLGEFGSVVFIAGNIPKVSEIISLVINIKIAEYDYSGATAIALVMLIISFFMLLIINLLQKWSSRSYIV